MTITASIVLDSVDGRDRRITTMLLRYPRFIHAELMTHRVFSRNASSSRAIPFKTQKKVIYKDPATFVQWGKNQKGMSASEELIGWRKWLAQFSWFLGLWLLLPVTWLMSLSGVHKQVINRMLEPWSHINVLVTATEWDNFFELRLDPNTTQPEMCSLAQAMYVALTSSKPEVRKWHLPFISILEHRDLPLNQLFMISAARCARLSYMTWGETMVDWVKDLKLAHGLKTAGHMSPFEHQATIVEQATRDKSKHFAWRSNFFGWESFRWKLEHGVEV